VAELSAAYPPKDMVAWPPAAVTDAPIDPAEVAVGAAATPSAPAAEAAILPVAPATPASSGSPDAPEGTDPTLAFVFPGQGAQSVGMLGAATSALPPVAALIAAAPSVVGLDVAAVVRDGPKTALDDTAVAQPALLIAGLAGLAARTDPASQTRASDRDRPSAAAGLSLGEYTALVAAGALAPEDALRLVAERGRAMKEAAAAGGEGSQAMLSVVGLDDDALEAVCAEARKLADAAAGSTGLDGAGGPAVCQVANLLAPTIRSLSGHRAALEHAARLAKDRGATQTTFLAVAGAFHTPLMAPAAARLAAALATVDIKRPRFPVWSNVTAQPFPSDPETIRALLTRQLCEPVQWEATLKGLVAAGRTRVDEMGPQRQIRSMMRRVDMAVWKEMTHQDSK